MKRVTTLLISLILILSCTACSGNNDGGNVLSDGNITTESISDNTLSLLGETDDTSLPDESDENNNATYTNQSSESSKSSNKEDTRFPENTTKSEDTEKKPEAIKPSDAKPQNPASSDMSKPEETKPKEPATPNPQRSNILVVYFSATGTTRSLAEYAADILNADIYEIVPENPYTEEDLAYYTDGRADREQNDSSARPAISGGVENMEQYDTIMLGYPIWHGQAPRIISTFLESYDFSGKTIVPFCTSHSSGIGSSDVSLHALAEEADWLKGRRFAGGTSRSAIEEWIKGLDLPTIKILKNGGSSNESISN